eukprot:TRINITY_DN12453_c0_g4_i5.p1 TRINITY_DN12453_c0_g4~~TRINITY_DN12453_c0_g4_i5.p1  ORF type:complete len:454 (+),score=137.06 TRINITY_DN12453_c0_g4_i5:117-1478(+)
MKVQIYNRSGDAVPVNLETDMEVGRVREILYEHGFECESAQLVKLNAIASPIELSTRVDKSWHTLNDTAMAEGDDWAITTAPVFADNNDGEESASLITVDQVKEFTAPLQANTDNSQRSGKTSQPKPVLFNGQEMDLHGKLIAVVTTLHTRACKIQTELGIYQEETDDDDMDEAAEETYDPRSEVDGDHLAMLSGMGFPDMHAIRALIATSGNVEQAMEWLLMRDGDPSLDEPITPPPKAVKSKRGIKFHPDPSAFRQLKEMGFDEESIMAALQIARNQASEATDLLLSGQDVKAMLATQVDPSVDENNPVMQAILKLPEVNESLHLPRMRQGLEMILQDFNKATALLNDGQLGPALLAVVKKVQSYFPDGEGEAPEPGNDELEEDRMADDDDVEHMRPAEAYHRLQSLLQEAAETMGQAMRRVDALADEEEEEEDDDDDDQDDSDEFSDFNF